MSIIVLEKKRFDIAQATALARADGRLFIGFSRGHYSWGEKGVGVLDIETGKIKYLKKTDGLCDNNVTAIKREGDFLWLGTQKGLSRYDIKKDKIENLEGGGRGGDLHINDLWVEDKIIWLATMDGIAYYDRIGKRFVDTRQLPGARMSITRGDPYLDEKLKRYVKICRYGGKMLLGIDEGIKYAFQSFDPESFKITGYSIGCGYVNDIVTYGDYVFVCGSLGVERINFKNMPDESFVKCPGEIIFEHFLIHSLALVERAEKKVLLIGTHGRSLYVYVFEKPEMCLELEDWPLGLEDVPSRSEGYYDIRAGKYVSYRVPTQQDAAMNANIYKIYPYGDEVWCATGCKLYLTEVIFKEPTPTSTWPPINSA